ncbi:hypothetical protein B0J12DRAFT_785256 [Macrophomina phaseolina]|uniref:Uncharacterized protein n=1 Tax=Macrophomina phaseolina TaxID=35725 RepID=A0ABQ8GG65_9PEZI|nr:hypothetical protein B0J12DRAFT_785256 [Macrophomina phaseolina]
MPHPDATDLDYNESESATASFGDLASTDVAGIVAATEAAPAEEAPPEPTPLEDAYPSLQASPPTETLGIGDQPVPVMALPPNVMGAYPSSPPSPLEPEPAEGTASVQTETWSGPSGPVATLVPTVPSDHDGADLWHLDPTIANVLYFTENGVADPTISQIFALMRVNATYPSVVLEHSNFIRNVTCSGQGLEVQFATPEAFEYARSVWNGTFVVVTSSVGCAAALQGQHTYWLVNAATFPEESNTAVLTSQEIAVENALNDVNLIWGTQDPTTTTSYPAATSGTPTMNGGSTSTTQTPSGSSCGEPPAQFIRGFAAAPCGSNFDKVLDDKLGYYSLNDRDFSTSLKEFAPGLKNTSLQEFQPDDAVYMNATAQQRRDLHRFQRRWSFTAFIQKAVSTVTSVVSTATNVVKQAATAVVSAAKTAGQFINDQIDKLTSGSIDTRININIGPKNLVDSKYWGPAFQIFHKEKENKAGTVSGSVDLYCVKCGITGDARVSGEIGFSIGSLRLNKGRIALDGSLTAGLNLGLAAEAQYRNTFRKTIAETGAPGFSIPAILTVGPIVALDAKVDVNIQAQGQLLVGAQATISNYHASIDLVNSPRYQKSGFDPRFTTTFTASGQINADIRLGVPLTVGVGLSIPAISYRKALSVSSEPYVSGSAQYAYSNTQNLPCNNGVSYDLRVGNEVYVDFLGLETVSIYNFVSPPLAKGCYKLGGRRRSIAHRQVVPADDTNAPATPGGSATTTNYGADGRLDSNEISTLALNQVNAEQKEANQTNTNGILFTKIQDSTRQWHLASDSTGVFNLQAIGDQDGGLVFGSLTGVIASDASNRVMHYYPDQMRKLGVSRFLMSSVTSIPNGSDFISLVPISTGRTTPVLMAVDSAGNSFYTVACNLDGNSNKIFLVSDINVGPTTLQGEDFWYIVAGGITSKCAPIAFTSY